MEDNDRAFIPSNVKLHKDFPLPKINDTKAHYGQLVREYSNTFKHNQARVQRVRASEKLATALGKAKKDNLLSQGSHGGAAAGVRAAEGAQTTAAGARGSMKRKGSTSTGGADGSPYLDAAKRAKAKAHRPFGL